MIVYTLMMDDTAGSLGQKKLDLGSVSHQAASNSVNFNRRYAATYRDSDRFALKKVGIAPLDILKMRPLTHTGAVDPAVGKSYQGGRYPLLFKGVIRGPGPEPFNKEQTRSRGLGCALETWLRVDPRQVRRQ